MLWLKEKKNREANSNLPMQLCYHFFINKWSWLVDQNQTDIHSLGQKSVYHMVSLNDLTKWSVFLRKSLRLTASKHQPYDGTAQIEEDRWCI
jgi:hypothetical protein